MSNKKFFNFEVKSTEKSGIFSGYASVFNVIDHQGDIIKPGAFDIHLNQNGVIILWQHNHEEPIGKVLNIVQDEKGLYIEGKLITAIPKAQIAYTLLEQGIIYGLSIGYVTKNYSIDRETGARIIKKLELFEISLVTFPANENARVIKLKNNDDSNNDDSNNKFTDKIYSII